jgi:hypothetical protein
VPREAPDNGDNGTLLTTDELKGINCETIEAELRKILHL